MKIEEIEKQLKALAVETVEKALSDRETTRSNVTATPVPVVQTKAVSSTAKVGFNLQAKFAQRAQAQGVMPAEKAKMFVERAASLTPGAGLELNGRARSPELVQAVSESSFLIAAGAELWTDYETELAIGKWGGFTVSAVSSTGSPADTSATTSDLVLKSYFGAAKVSVANSLLENPRAGETLASDLIKKLANFADTKIVAGDDANANEPDGIKVQTNAANKVAATAMADANEVLADIGNGLAAIHAAGMEDTSSAIIVVSPALFYKMASARDAQGYAFPSMQGEDPRVLGRRVIAHSSVGADAMVLMPGMLAYGLSLPPNVGVGLEGTDLSAGTQTVFGRIGYHGLLKHDKAAYFVTGAATSWFASA